MFVQASVIVTDKRKDASLLQSLPIFCKLLIHNVFYFRPLLVGHLSVDQMSGGQISVDPMSVNQIFLT